MSRLVVHLLIWNTSGEKPAKGVLCGQHSWQFADSYPWIVNCRKCIRKLDKHVEDTVRNKEKVLQNIL